MTSPDEACRETSVCEVVVAMRSLAVIGVSAVLVSACGGFTDTSHLQGYCFNPGTMRYELCSPDAEVDAGVWPDAMADAGPADIGEPDTGVWPDATAEDVGLVDMGMVDSGEHPDAAPIDMGQPDAGVWPDAAPVDMGFPDSGVHPDAMAIDVGVVDSGVWPDAAPVDVGFPDSGVWPDAAPVDSGPIDTGVAPDAGFLHSATIRFAGPGRGRVSKGDLGYPSYTCNYDGGAQTLICYERFRDGSYTVLLNQTGSPLEFDVSFHAAEITFSGQGIHPSQLTGFTGDCMLPPRLGNGCTFYYPLTRAHYSATVRFD